MEALRAYYVYVKNNHRLISPPGGVDEVELLPMTFLPLSWTLQFIKRSPIFKLFPSG